MAGNVSLFDAFHSTRKSIQRCHEYHPNMPPAAEMRKMGINHFVDLATNENPHGISPAVCEAILQEAQNSLHHYPESTCFELRKKLAEVHGLKPENFVVDNGLDAVVALIGLTFLEETDQIITAAGTFPAYENTANKIGADIIKVPLTKDYRFDINKISELARSTPKAVFICNPNNPTGTIITNKEFVRLMDSVPPETLVIMDEAFCEFVDDSEYPLTIRTLQRHPNLIILRTFSKSFALAGLRIGYAIASEEITAMLMRAREPFPVNRLAQAAALTALTDGDFMAKTLEINRFTRNRMIEALRAMGLSCTQSQSNFVFVDLAQPAELIWKRMFERGVIVRKLDSFGYPNALRICLGKQRDLQWALETLADVLDIHPAPIAFDKNSLD